jgi:hypothetical protein
VIPEKNSCVFLGQDDTEFAWMSNPEKLPEDASGMLIVDCGAPTAITKSLFNMTSVESKVIPKQLAMSGASMKSTHVGMKTYNVYDRIGTLRPITTRAYNVKELNQDQLGGSALTAADYRVILDKHDEIAGIYPVRDDATIDAANNFPGVGNYLGGLFYLQTEPIDASKYAKMSGYHL